MIGGGLAVLKNLASNRAWCVACDKHPDKVEIGVGVLCDVLLTARCHGSVDHFKIIEEDFEDAKVQPAMAWMEKLFPLDGYPDMKELLKYNREPWRFDDVR